LMPSTISRWSSAINIRISVSPWHRGIPPEPVYPLGNIAAVGTGSNTSVPARTA
jgi:hypothetical protein